MDWYPLGFLRFVDLDQFGVRIIEGQVVGPERRGWKTFLVVKQVSFRGIHRPSVTGRHRLLDLGRGKDDRTFLDLGIRPVPFPVLSRKSKSIEFSFAGRHQPGTDGVETQNDLSTLGLVLGQNRPLVNNRQAIGLAQGEVGMKQTDRFLVLGMQFDGITRIDGHRHSRVVQPGDTFLMLSRLTAQGDSGPSTGLLCGGFKLSNWVK